MRHARAPFRIAAFLTAVTVLACAGGEKADTVDSAATAAAAAPPPPESYTMAANDGAWSGDITPAGIVFRHKRNDSLMFAYKPPTMNGAIADFESLITDKDTIRLSVTIAPTSCTDKNGKTYTHIAQVYLSGDVELNSRGCAEKK